MGASLVIPGITDPQTLICIARSRNYKQYLTMVNEALENRCPFCGIDPEINKVIAMNMGWNAWQNPFPEKNTKHHFIIAPLRHVKSLMELKAEEKLDLFLIMFELQKGHGYMSSGVLIRDGDARLSAGTVQHLHVHVMVPDGKGRVETPFYKGPGEEEEGIERAVIFEKVRQGLEITAAERSIVSGRI